MAATCDLPKRGKSKLLLNGEEFSVGYQIDKIGFGWYQVQAFIFCAGAIVCEGANLSSIAGVKVPIYNEFQVTSRFGQSLLMTLLYAGFALGTGFSGSVGDVKGRRLPMMIGFIGTAFSQVLLFYATWLPGIYVLVFALGFFAGFPIPAAVTLLGEVCPGYLRGITVAALCIGFSIGELFSAVGLRNTVPDLVHGAWRYQVLWAAIPPVFLLVLGLFCSATRYDSPHFLAAHNYQKELRDALNLIAEMNGRPELALEFDLSGDEGQSEVTFAEVRGILFSGSMGLSTFSLCVMFFAYNWGYYGMVDFWPLGWAGMRLQGVDKATEMIYTALIGFFGVPVAIFTLSKINRRPGLCCSALICFAATICLHGLLTDSLTKGWIGVVVFKVFWMTFQMTLVILPNEIYPTRISVWGWSMVCFFGRIGCILAPIVIGYTLNGFLVGLGALLLVSASLVWLLPETKDIDIETLDDPALLNQLGSSSYGSFKTSCKASPA